MKHPRRPAILFMRWFHVLGLCWLGVLALPFVGLLVATPWSHFHLADGDSSALAVSAVYTLVALALVVAFGTPLAYWLARRQFRGKWLAEALIWTSLLTPPLAMGILLTSLYGPYGWLGSSLRHAGVVLTNSAPAFVLAQIYASAAYYIVGARAAFEAVPSDLEGVGRTLGDSPWQVFLRITLPLARAGLAAAASVAWVRALGEFGIVLIMAYYPQGIPVKLWVNLQDSGLPAVYPLLWLFFLIGLPVPVILGLRMHKRRLGEPASRLAT